MTINKILTFILCFGSVSALAEWRFIAENESRVQYYIDDSTIKPEKSLRKVWMLLNRKSADQYNEASTRVFTEFDCEQKKHRLIQVDGFKNEMATGAMTRSEAVNSDWRYISPATVINEVLTAVCNPSKPIPTAKKLPLYDCNGEADFVKSIVDRRLKGESMEGAMKAVEHGVRQSASPAEYEFRLNRAKSMVQYAYIGRAWGDESARIWFDACTKQNQNMKQ